MTRQRKQFKKKSNNTANNNKNICALRVAEYLRVESMVRYLHTKDDLVRAVRKAYTVRSRMSAVNDGVLWLDETQVIRIESEDTYANDRKQFFKWCSVVKIVAHDYEGNVTSIGGTNGAEVYELVKAFGIRAEHVDILTDEVTEIKP